MSFADKYFSRVKTYDSLIKQKPAENLQISVVIPVYNEPEVIKTLQSLLRNSFAGFNAEIIFVINSAINEEEKILLQNKKSKTELKAEFEKNNNSNLKMFILEFSDLPTKTAGVGLARKIGMDEALRRFNSINSPESIIVSLDADTLVAENYLQAIFNFYSENPKICGANIKFEHPTEGNVFNKDIYKAIIIYETYLHYYVQALRYANFPHSYHTIGSAFCVRANSYAKQGGMVVNKSGEDFYFLHKVIPSCKFGEIKSTTVYPSPRITDRVIFGTGVAIKQIIDNDFVFKTYKLDAFLLLKDFFEQIDSLFNEKTIDDLEIDDLLSEFLKQNKIEKKLKEIRANTSNKENFRNRFFSWFNALKVLKFLNFAHIEKFEKSDIIDEAKKLLQKLEVDFSSSDIELLDYFRKK